MEEGALWESLETSSPGLFSAGARSGGEAESPRARGDAEPHRHEVVVDRRRMGAHQGRVDLHRPGAVPDHGSITGRQRRSVAHGRDSESNGTSSMPHEGSTDGRQPGTVAPEGEFESNERGLVSNLEELASNRTSLDPNRASPVPDLGDVVAHGGVSVRDRSVVEPDRAALVRDQRRSVPDNLSSDREPVAAMHDRPSLGPDRSSLVRDNVASVRDKPSPVRDRTSLSRASVVFARDALSSIRLKLRPVRLKPRPVRHGPSPARDKPSPARERLSVAPSLLRSDRHLRAIGSHIPVAASDRVAPVAITVRLVAHLGSNGGPQLWVVALEHRWVRHGVQEVRVDLPEVADNPPPVRAKVPTVWKEPGEDRVLLPRRSKKLPGSRWAGRTAGRPAPHGQHTRESRWTVCMRPRGQSPPLPLGAARVRSFLDACT